MKCPLCGEETCFVHCESYKWEPHGEETHEEWLKCWACSGCITKMELDEANKEADPQETEPPPHGLH